MMVIDNGSVPEFAVTAVLPSGLNVKPKGCGAVLILLPAGVIYLPFGMTVFPVLFILVYSLPAGAVMIQRGYSPVFWATRVVVLFKKSARESDPCRSVIMSSRFIPLNAVNVVTAFPEKPICVKKFVSRRVRA